MVNYIILPLFAFANAGISLTADHGGIEVGAPTWAVMTGLLVGKFAGIYFFTWLVIKTGFAGLLKGMTWVNLTGICLLGGIGFTVSLFIANLSFGDSPVLLTQAKMGSYWERCWRAHWRIWSCSSHCPKSLYRNKATGGAVRW